MNSELDKIVQEQFKNIKKMAILILGTLIIMLGFLAIGYFPIVEDVNPDILIVFIVMVPSTIICGLVCSRLHKVQWVKNIALGKDSKVIDKSKLERVSRFYILFILASFVSWFHLGVMGLIGVVFYGGKHWLVIFGIPAITMMVVTWPKKDDLINFLKVD